MPTYDYTCKGCGHRLELFQQMTASPKKTCPSCGAKKLTRHIGTGAGIIFKGSGFYATDYRKGAPPKESPSPKTDGKKSDDKTSCRPSGCEKPGCPTKSSGSDAAG